MKTHNYVIPDAPPVAPAECILVDDKQAAAMLGMSVSGFQRLGLPRVRIARRCVRTPIRAIHAFISKRLVEGRAAARRNQQPHHSTQQEVNGENLLA
jgi:hypothetical protein